jgi:putative transposase
MSSALVTIQRAYKTELDPTPEQGAAFGRHAGAARYIFNFALGEKQAAYAAYRSHREMLIDAGMDETIATRIAREHNPTPTAMGGLNRALTVKKRTDAPWLYEISNSVLQNAIRQADAAYTNFFRRVREGVRGREVGFPRFKARGRGTTAFKFNGVIRVTEHGVRLPTIGEVRVKESGYLPYAGVTITSATVSQVADRWFVSLQVSEEIEPVRHTGPMAAVHLGVRNLATTYDGTQLEVIANPRVLERELRTLQKRSRALSRKKIGSANRQKARISLARVHMHIANIRAHELHQVSHRLTRQYGTLIIEGWNVREMLEGAAEEIPGLARRLADASLGELRRQIGYKGDWRGCQVIIIEAGFPSTRRCSRCGVVADREIRATTFHCAACGYVADRDDNAATNVWQEGQRLLRETAS